ncbi:reverse transcriptase domain-containing protein [Tanacetum coccineum]
MPLSVYTKLGLPALQSTRMTLELANCSLCVPKGIARDVLVLVGKFTFPADFVVVDFECNYRVPLILGRPFLRTARVLIDVHGEELVIRDGMERIVFKPDGSQDKESIHMMDIYDDRVKDVCEPKSNDDSPTSTIVEEFESLLGDIIRQKEEVKGISDPVARRKACFNQGREEVHKENLKSNLNPLFEKDKEIISNEASRQISPKVDVKTIVSFFAPIGNCVRKWATSEFVKDNDEFNHEVFKSDNENDLGIHDNKKEEIAFLDGLLEDENFFETK